MRPLATPALVLALTLASSLALGTAVRADEAADKLAVAQAIVEKTLLKNLDAGFGGALEKTVAQMAPEKAEKVRADARAELAAQRKDLLEGLSKHYADRFSLSELKHLQGIYDDPVYQRFQALNADPKSEINTISQAAVSRLLNLLTLAAASEQPAPGAPGPMPGR